MSFYRSFYSCFLLSVVLSVTVILVLLFYQLIIWSFDRSFYFCSVFHSIYPSIYHSNFCSVCYSIYQCVIPSVLQLFCLSHYHSVCHFRSEQMQREVKIRQGLLWHQQWRCQGGWRLKLEEGRGRIRNEIGTLVRRELLLSAADLRQRGLAVLWH